MDLTAVQTSLHKRMKLIVQIRKATLPDLEGIRDIYNEAILTTTATFDTEPKSADERLQWFQSHDEPPTTTRPRLPFT